MAASRSKKAARASTASASPLRAADKMLRTFRRKGATVAEVPTVERLMHAGEAVRIETYSRSVEVVRDGRAIADTVAAQRLRIDDGPLARLRTRGLLATGTDAAQRNAILGDAGERYRRHWYHAGLDGLRTLDISRERVSGGQSGLLRTERQVAHFQLFGRAVAAMPEETRRVVDAIVLHDRDPIEIGRDVSGYRQDKQATAVALYVLRSGLTALAVHFGLLRKGAAAEHRISPASVDQSGVPCGQPTH